MDSSADEHTNHTGTGQAGTTLQRSREEWLAALTRMGIRPARSMGQNFLVEPGVVAAMVDVSGVGNGDRVVEIGPGPGILTRELLDRGAVVTAVELDRNLARHLRMDFATCERFTLMERDARYVELAHVATPFHLVANLPYSTGTVILRHFLEMDPGPVTLTVMVQREVAERMLADAPEMSLLALAVQIHVEPTLAFTVPPEVFVPAPKVESAVVHLVRRSAPLVSGASEKAMFRTATLCFQRKRKTMSNGVAQGLEVSRAEAEALLAKACIDPGLRPQAVELSQWIALGKAIA